MMLSNHLVLCCPCLLLPSIFLSIRIFSNESAFLIRWPKHWSVSFSISPSRGHSGLNSFRIALFDLLVVQWTLKSLPQLHTSKALILRGSAFFIVHLSRPYMTTGKTISFTIGPLSAKQCLCFLRCYLGFPGGASGKNPPDNVGDIRDVSSIPASGWSPGGGHSNPLQYSCLETPMDRLKSMGSQRVRHDKWLSTHLC